MLKTDPMVTLKVNNVTVVAKIVTGARGNVMSQKDFLKLQTAEKIKANSATLPAYGGSELIPIGVADLLCHLATRPYKLPFYIVKGKVLPLLGVDACIDMGLFSFGTATHHLMPTLDSTQRNLVDYKDFFDDELGKLPLTYSMILDPDVKPVVRPANRIPVAM